MSFELSQLPDDWTDEQRAIFARAHRFFVANQELVKHPEAAVIPAEHWSTIAWNAAYMAAQPLLDGQELIVIDSETDEEVGRENIPVLQ